jgi:hypothetical protein
MKNIVFLSGLPRSGITVLSSMLNQHSDIHATTTSPVADLVSVAIDNWPSMSRAIKNPDPMQYGNIITSLIQGAHQHVDTRVVMDKNRLWPRLAPCIYRCTKVKPKIICTVRDITEVLTSYILLIQRNKNQVTFIDRELVEAKLPINIKNRCRIAEKYINHPYQSLRVGYTSKSAELIFLDYHDIVDRPQETIDRICKFLEIDTYTVRTQDLQKMDENDEFHGGIDGLHDVRSILKKTSPAPETVLGRELTEYYKNMKMEFWRPT